MSPDKLLPVVKSGQVSQAVIDEKVRRILWAMFTLGIFDRKEDASHQRRGHSGTAGRGAGRSGREHGPAQERRRRAAARSRRACVRSPSSGRTPRVARTGGGGSSRVTPKIEPVAPLEAVKDRVGSRVEVGYALGCSMEGEDKAKETPAARAR